MPMLSMILGGSGHILLMAVLFTFVMGLWGGLLRNIQGGFRPFGIQLTHPFPLTAWGLTVIALMWLTLPVSALAGPWWLFLPISAVGIGSALMLSNGDGHMNIMGEYPDPLAATFRRNWPDYIIGSEQPGWSYAERLIHDCFSQTMHALSTLLFPALWVGYWHGWELCGIMLLGSFTRPLAYYISAHLIRNNAWGERYTGFGLMATIAAAVASPMFRFTPIG